MAEEGLGENHSGEQRWESAVAKGERIIAGELRRLGWKQEDLAARRQSDPEKVAIAMRLRRETTLTIKHIASRLSLGTPKSASTRLREWQIAHPDPTHPVHSPAKRCLSMHFRKAGLEKSLHSVWRGLEPRITPFGRCPDRRVLCPGAV
jgi:hypothetical protein